MNQELIERANESIAKHKDTRKVESKAYILIAAIALLPEPDSEFQRNLKRTWLGNLDDVIKELK